MSIARPARTKGKFQLNIMNSIQGKFRANTNIIQFKNKKITRIRFENHPNTNRNNIRVEKITRIQIRIIFNFKKSPEHEYEYKYSA